MNKKGVFLIFIPIVAALITFYYVFGGGLLNGFANRGNSRLVTVGLAIGPKQPDGREAPVRSEVRLLQASAGTGPHLGGRPFQRQPGRIAKA
ncbi:MAG: hypothetical protein WDN27_04800 [Candidatus Saccharibacteria bacterium]